MNQQNHLADNLRQLCSREPSVSEVCRRIGLNRQQFARYLNGQSRPSAHTLWRLASYFDIADSDLLLPTDLFTRRLNERQGWRERRAEKLTSVFPGNIRHLRLLLGWYHAHYRSPSMPGHLVRALVEFSEADGFIQSRTAERTRHPQTGLISGARFLGLVSMMENAVFLVERGRRSNDGISETILEPAHRGTNNWLFGTTLAYSWRIRKPFTSPCVWKKLRPTMELKAALAACGAFPANSRDIDPIVTRHFDENA
ncbi:MAG: helix-turn-helix transcriptional regulator [Pseudomonadota bacterium]